MAEKRDYYEVLGVAKNAELKRYILAPFFISLCAM